MSDTGERPVCYVTQEMWDQAQKDLAGVRENAALLSKAASTLERELTTQRTLAEEAGVV